MTLTMTYNFSPRAFVTAKHTSEFWLGDFPKQKEHIVNSLNCLLKNDDYSSKYYYANKQGHNIFIICSMLLAKQDVLPHPSQS